MLKTLLLVLPLGMISCSTDRSAPSSRSTEAASRTAQSIVDEVARKHADVARLSIHAMPAGGSVLRIVASTVPGRVGESSDPEDSKAIETGEPIVLHEARNLDYTLPVKAAAGQPALAVGVTISGAAGAGTDTLTKRARAVADEVAAALRATKKPLW